MTVKIQRTTSKSPGRKFVSCPIKGTLVLPRDVNLDDLEWQPSTEWKEVNRQRVKELTSRHAST